MTGIIHIEHISYISHITAYDGEHKVHYRRRVSYCPICGGDPFDEECSTCLSMYSINYIDGNDNPLDLCPYCEYDQCICNSTIESRLCTFCNIEFIPTNSQQIDCTTCI